MKNQLKYLAGAALLGSSLCANAGQFGYDFLQFDYISGEADVLGGTLDSDTVKVSASFEADAPIYIKAGFELADFGNLAGDRNTFDLGVGAHAALSQKADLYFDASVIYAKESDDSADTGYGLNIGLRFAASESFELGTSLGYVDIFDFDDKALSFGVTARLKVSDRVSIGAGYTTTTGGYGDSTGYNAGLRLAF